VEVTWVFATLDIVDDRNAEPDSGGPPGAANGRDLLPPSDGRTGPGIRRLRALSLDFSGDFVVSSLGVTE
jgi:hypothetical protein